MSIGSLAERYAQAYFSADWDALRELRHDDFISRWPQSGEIVRGHDNWVEITKRHPQSGGEFSHVHGAEKPRVTRLETALPLGPPVLALGGSGDSFTLEGKLHYPDGSAYFVASICKVKDEKVITQTSYFGEPFDPPEWRADLVELED